MSSNKEPIRPYRGTTGFIIYSDGVLVDTGDPPVPLGTPWSTAALCYLQKKKIPFIIASDQDSKQEASYDYPLHTILPLLDPLRENQQTATRVAFSHMSQFKNRCVLALGGYDEGPDVLARYGFKKVLTPGDLDELREPESELIIAAIFILSDPVDDAQSIADYWNILLEVIFTDSGRWGTWSPDNGNPKLLNSGWAVSRPATLVMAQDFDRATNYRYPAFNQHKFKHELVARLKIRVGALGFQDQTQSLRILDPVPTVRPTRCKWVESLLIQSHREMNSSGPPLDTVYVITNNPRRDVPDVRQHHESGCQCRIKWKSALVTSENDEERSVDNSTKPVRRGDPPLPKKPYEADFTSDHIAGAIGWALEQESCAEAPEFRRYISNYLMLGREKALEKLGTA